MQLQQSVKLTGRSFVHYSWSDNKGIEWTATFLFWYYFYYFIRYANNNLAGFILSSEMVTW